MITAIESEAIRSTAGSPQTLSLTTFGGHEARSCPTLPLATEKPHPSGKNAFITEAYTTLPRTLKLGVCTTARTKILVGGPM